jgi:hypothetical protein
VACLVDAGFGFGDVMDMAWSDARDFLQAAQTMRRQRLLDAAVAARAAQADKKDWERWLKEVSAAAGR